MTTIDTPSGQDPGQPAQNDDLIDQIFADLQRRVRFAPSAPPDGFDPVTAGAEQLREFGFPARPDPRRTPAAFANWRRAVSPPLTLVRRAPRASLRELFGVRLNRRQRIRSAPPTQEASRNWSGAYVRANPGESWVLVQGMWNVPRAYPPPAALSGGAWSDGDYRSSTWIGLDGHDPTSLSLPQAGTVQSVDALRNALTPTTGAWWQWWVRDDDLNYPVDLLATHFPVAPGDLVYCQIDVLSTTSVGMFIKNQCSGAAFSFTVAAPGAMAVEGRTAEWIVERPTQVGKDEFHQFANYGSVSFHGCNAQASIAAPAGTAAPAAVVEDRQLQQAKLIRMVDWNDPIQPGIVLSSAARQGDEAALVFYRGNGP